MVQQLASQLEQAKLQVNKDTPVFTTIKPVTVPYEKTAPKRSQIVISFLFLGFVLSSGYVLVKEYVIEFIKSIKYLNKLLRIIIILISLSLILVYLQKD